MNAVNALVPFVMSSVVLAAPPLLDPHDGASSLGRAVASNELAEPLAATEAQLMRGAARVPQSRVLPIVFALFEHPWSLPEVASALAQSARTPRLAQTPGAVAAMALGAPGATPPSAEGAGRATITSSMQAIYALDYFLRGGDRLVREAMAPAVGIEPGPGNQEKRGDGGAEAAPILAAREALAADALKLLAIAERTPMPEGDDIALALRVGEAAWKVDWTAMARAAAHANFEHTIECDWEAAEVAELPAELAGAVDGTILEVSYLDPVGWAIVGGPGANRYDMSRIVAVFDPAGDDLYEWPIDVVGSRAIIDIAGNDRYISKGAVGPGGALLGYGFLRDVAGNDYYEGVTLTSGAAMFGVGTLIDDAGDDIHVSRAFAQGAGFFGVGVLVDGAGSDRYEARVLCQGVGAPHGVGLLADRAGNDLYLVHGAPSAYNTPATFKGFSQGVGYGVRRDLAGGVGLLVDDEGSDRYESGEFSQGGGYFFGLGVLADKSGRDLYRGDRYAQGFAAHQAFGALLDDEGNDRYWSRTAAGQGAAWDESVAMLIDRAGDDDYRADGLSQGAAAQQAIGVLVDLDGRDVFEGLGMSVQGAGGSNDYRFAECSCFSLGVLLKREGTARYSSGRESGTVTYSADIVTASPARSSAYGLLIDETLPARDHSPAP